MKDAVILNQLVTCVSTVLLKQVLCLSVSVCMSVGTQTKAIFDLQIRIRIRIRFSESVYSVCEPESGFLNPANPVLTWIY